MRHLRGVLFFLGIITAITFSVAAQPASAATWQKTNLHGFGKTANESAELFKQAGALFAVTENSNGAQAYEYLGNGERWQRITDWPWLNEHNTRITAKLQYRKQMYVAVQNNTTGAQVWRRTRNNNWHQVGEFGFGFAGNQRVLHLVRFQDNIHAFVQNEQTGTVSVWRKADFHQDSWELLTTLSRTAFYDLDAVVVYKDTLYIANGDPAILYSSSDGVRFSEVRTFNSQISSFTQYRGKLLAAGTEGRFCYESRQPLYTTNSGTEWSVIKNRPRKTLDRLTGIREGMCYTQLIKKPGKNVLFALAFDIEDAVLYKRKNGRWSTLTRNAFRADTEASFHEQFSDGIFFQKKLFVATENSTKGTVIYAQP